MRANNPSPRDPVVAAATRLGSALLPPAILAAAFAAMLVFSWEKWPDVLVDFGVEVYVPWQLAGGKVLGRDIIIWGTGPLPYYVNAVLFAVFGSSLKTLFAFNVLVLATITAILYRLLREIGDRFGATLACLALITIFGFGQYEWIGASNYIAPYTHGVTHGLLLALASVWFVWRHARSRAIRDVCAAATLAGLTFLAKPEVFVASAGALLVSAALLVREAPGRRAGARLLAAVLVPLALPTVISLAVFTVTVDADTARRATLAPWLTLATPLTSLPFYRWGLGLDEPTRNLGRAGLWLTGYAGVFGLAAIIDDRVRGARVRVAALCLGAVAVAAASLLVPEHAWLDVARPIPAIALVATGAAAAAAWRSPRPCPPTVLLHASLATLATLLLAKLGLNARLYHYGFVLAMPATLLVITWLASVAPRKLRERGASGIVLRVIVAALLAVMTGRYVERAAHYYGAKSHRVGTGRDGFWADGRGAYVNATLQALPLAAEQGASLAVLPEGAMINYLARRPSPTPYPTCMPDALAVVGEERLLSALVAAPPRLVVVAHRDASEHGAALFGRDYSLATRRWLETRYESLGEIGTSPYDPAGYGMRLYRLKPF